MRVPSLSGFLRSQKIPAFLDRLPNYRRRVLLARLSYTAWRFNAPLDVSIAENVRIGKRVNIEVRPKTATKLVIGADSTIGDDVRLRLRGGSLVIGNEVDIRATCVLNVGGGDLRLDGPNNLGWGVTIHCAESVTLERFAHVAEYSTIVDSSHFYTTPDEWSYLNTKTAPVSLGVDVWVCPKSTITSGVTIGDHTIVASNSVVVKDVPAGVLVSGVPAKVVRELDQPWR